MLRLIFIALGATMVSTMALAQTWTLQQKPGTVEMLPEGVESFEALDRQRYEIVLDNFDAMAACFNETTQTVLDSESISNEQKATFAQDIQTLAAQMAAETQQANDAYLEHRRTKTISSSYVIFTQNMFFWTQKILMDPYYAHLADEVVQSNGACAMMRSTSLAPTFGPEYANQ